MFNIIGSCLPATMVAETALIVADGSPYDKLVDNIVMNNNSARR